MEFIKDAGGMVRGQPFNVKALLLFIKDAYENEGLWCCELNRRSVSLSHVLTLRFQNS